MNKIGKSGAILTIIAGALMIFAGIILFFGYTTIFATLFNNYEHPEAFSFVYAIIIVIAIINLLLGILNVVFASLSLKENSSLRITTGVFAIISIFFGFTFYFIPSVLFLIGGILVFCGKKNDKELRDVNSNINVKL